MKNNTRLFDILLGGICLAAMAVIFGALTMLLWNTLLTSVIGLPVINWWQAIGVSVFCIILFCGITMSVLYD